MNQIIHRAPEFKIQSAKSSKGNKFSILLISENINKDIRIRINQKFIDKLELFVQLSREMRNLPIIEREKIQKALNAILSQKEVNYSDPVVQEVSDAMRLLLIYMIATEEALSSKRQELSLNILKSIGAYPKSKHKSSDCEICKKILNTLES